MPTYKIQIVNAFNKIFKMANKIKAHTFFVELISALFILLFIYAAANKLLDFQKFQVQIGKSPVLAGLGYWVAVMIPSLEVLLSIGLIIRSMQLFALYASVFLMGLFTTYIFIILNFSESIPCSCGGVLENMNWTQHLWFNILFMVLGCTAVCVYPIQKNQRNIVQ